MKSIVLFSGGLDSTTCLYSELKKGNSPCVLLFDYGQRHAKELDFAKSTVARLDLDSFVVSFRLPWTRDALVNKFYDIPERHLNQISEYNIPNTYVPYRNTIFLSYGYSYAESIGADFIVIGANAVDYSGYPDCRSEYLKSMEQTMQLGGQSSNKISIHAPLLRLSKKEIIQFAINLTVPLDCTWSCYRGDQVPCEKCDSCVLRQSGFKSLNLIDPLLK